MHKKTVIFCAFCRQHKAKERAALCSPFFEFSLSDYNDLCVVSTDVKSHSASFNRGDLTGSGIVDIETVNTFIGKSEYVKI